MEKTQTRHHSQDRGLRWINAALAMLAVLIGGLVFYFDTFMEADSAIAALYGLAILLAAEMLPGIGVVLLAALCAVLTFVSFAASHWSQHASADLIRLSVSLLTIFMTTAIILRNQASKGRLVQSNDALHRGETRFRAMFEQSQVALWEQDFSKLKAFLESLRSDGIRDTRSLILEDSEFLPRCADLIETVNVNSATLEMLGRTDPKEVAGPIKRFLHPDDGFLTELIDAMFDGKTRVEGKGRLLKADGSALSVLIVLSFPEEPIGFDRIVVGMFDTTERDLASQALLVAQSEMARASRIATVGALSASIAHELNQPIGALLLNAQSCLRWMRKDPPDVASALEAADRIIRDSRRAADILKATREMVVQKPAKSEPVDLVALVAETCGLVEHELVSEAVVLQTRMPTRLPPVNVARAEFQQVLLNLINNGIQAVSGTPRNQRRMGIELEMVGATHIRLVVRDAGPGIKEEHFAKLFEPFFTTKPSGMGMGLAICRSIVEAHGGKLVAMNLPVGGAAFHVVLPVAANVQGKLEAAL